MMRLATASKAQINAAYNVVHPHLQLIIQQYVPGFFQGQIEAKLREPQTIQMICQIIDEAIVAAEKVPPG